MTKETVYKLSREEITRILLKELGIQGSKNVKFEYCGVDFCFTLTVNKEETLL